MLVPHKLFTPQRPQTPTAQGTWQFARLCLDPATGEKINVGIVFTDEQGRVESRFLRNVAGLRCLYNDDLANDAAFLIDQAEQTIEQKGTLPNGWNISLSHPLFVRGKSARIIVDELFQRLVPLGMRETTPELLDTDDHSHTTRSVRKTVRDLLKRHMRSEGAPEFWKASPVESHQDGDIVLLDLQIYGTSKACDVRGSITSAWYKTQYHRSAYLDRSANAILKSCKIYPSATNVMYLLQPQLGGDFKLPEITAIQNEIDSTAWLLKKVGAKVSTFDNERAMAQQILQDVGELAV